MLFRMRYSSGKDYILQNRIDHVTSAGLAIDDNMLNNFYSGVMFCGLSW